MVVAGQKDYWWDLPPITPVKFRVSLQFYLYCLRHTDLKSNNFRCLPPKSIMSMVVVVVVVVVIVVY